jgi:hypothetical protein
MNSRIPTTPPVQPRDEDADQGAFIIPGPPSTGGEEGFFVCSKCGSVLLAIVIEDPVIRLLCTDCKNHMDFAVVEVIDEVTVEPEGSDG